MNEEINLYQASAHLYDLDQRPITHDDIPFYLEYAKQCNGPVLELACGTGRVSIPLAQAGFEVWGLDLSLAMLGQFQSKLRTLPSDCRQRIHLTHGDMTDFSLDRQFDLIIIPFRAFQSLITTEQQQRCLDAVKNHLASGGLFIVNVFKPYARLDESWEHEETVDWKAADPRTGFWVKRCQIRRKIDLVNQIIYPEIVYYITQPDGTSERVSELLALKYYYEEQVKKLLVTNGFNIIQELGYYDGRSLESGPEMVFVCKERSN